MTALPPPTEHAEQSAYVAWFRVAYPGVLIYAIPNGAHLAGTAGQRAAKMAKLKAEGLVEGIPDLHIPAWRLWVEMKRRKGGKVSPAQAKMHDHLRGIGDRVIVARGWDEAREATATFAVGMPRDGWRSIGDIAAGLVRGAVS